jgi:alcohol dehydrogenase class IV
MNADPPLRYDFGSPQRVLFGWGRRKEAGLLARGLGRRALIVCGAPVLIDDGVIGQITESLRAAGVDAVLLETTTREPEVADVDRVAAAVREIGLRDGDFVLGIGGGAAIDLGKAVAAMAAQEESSTVKDYLENVGRDLKLIHDPLPVMAMPTTAGTGAEATRNAVISSYDPPFKKSLRSEKIMPRVALVDPELTVSLPRSVTVGSGLDAITQLIESFISKKAQPLPRALAVEGLRHALPALAEAAADGAARTAREKMAHAALLSGMALANSGLGMAHGVAAALGVHARVPHGEACALMLPTALQVNRPACEKEYSALAYLLFDEVAHDRPAEAADRFLGAIRSLWDRVHAPRRLSQVGVRRDQIPAIVRDARGSSMSGNPRDLSDEELTRILDEMY